MNRVEQTPRLFAADSAEGSALSGLTGRGSGSGSSSGSELRAVLSPSQQHSGSDRPSLKHCLVAFPMAG